MLFVENHDIMAILHWKEYKIMENISDIFLIFVKTMTLFSWEEDIVHWHLHKNKVMSLNLVHLYISTGLAHRAV